jgi:hypothetical protein
LPAPKVYIIVLNYNRKEDTLDCLDSLYKMDYPNFKVVMVDNGSSDGTALAVMEVYPHAHVIENRRNLMFSEGNNVGIRAALSEGADYVLLLNNDTVVAPDMLSRMVDAMQAHPAAGMAGPMIYYYPPKAGEPELIWYAGGIVKLWQGLTAHRGIRERDTGQYKGIGYTDYITGCALLATRECLENVGLLDPSYFIYAEDADLTMRARLAGYKLLFVPAATMWHKVSSSTGGEFSAFKIRNKIKSNLRFFVRYARPIHWLTIPWFVLGRGIMFAFRKLTG